MSRFRIMAVAGLEGILNKIPHIFEIKNTSDAFNWHLTDKQLYCAFITYETQSKPISQNILKVHAEKSTYVKEKHLNRFQDQRGTHTTSSMKRITENIQVAYLLCS